MKAYDHLAKLYQLELYEDAILLFELMEMELGNLTVHAKAFVYVWAGDAYAEEGKYAPAIKAYKQALAQHRLLPKPITSPKMMTEVEVQYRLYRAFLRDGQHEAGHAVLKQVNVDCAPPKMKHAMAKLALTKTKGASDNKCTFQDVLDACPSAINAVSVLFRQGKLNRDQFPTVEDCAFVDVYLDAQFQLGQRKWTKVLELLENNAHLNPRMTNIMCARVFGMLGMRKEAAREWQNAFDADHRDLIPPMLMAFAKSEDATALESMTRRLEMKPGVNSMESFLCWGLLAKLRNKPHESVMTFVDQAIACCKVRGSPINSECVQLKAAILRDLSRTDDARTLLNTHLLADNTNVDVYDSLTRVFMYMKRPERAASTAESAVTSSLRSPLAILLHAEVLICMKHNPEVDGLVDARRRAALKAGARLMEDLLMEVPWLTDAYLLLSEFHCDRHEFEEAVRVLRTATDKVPPFDHASSAAVSVALTESLMKCKNCIQAYHEQQRALMYGSEEVAEGLMTELNKLLGKHSEGNVLVASAITPMGVGRGAPRRRRPRGASDA